LLELPYDIRFLIYQRLFPPSEQIYIQVQNGGKLRAILADSGSEPGTICTPILRSCKALYAEATGYLYNNYLFNIVGIKSDCLSHYKPFLATLEKHARNEVRVNAFSNGEHSATMCISLQAGDAKMTVLNRRRRGQPKAIEQLEKEYRAQVKTGSPTKFMLVSWAAVGVATLVALLAWALASSGSPFNFSGWR
jgi:hypothetical protein